MFKKNPVAIVTMILFANYCPVSSFSKKHLCPNSEKHSYGGGGTSSVSVNMATAEKSSGPYSVAVCDVRMPPSVTPSFRTRLFYPTNPDANSNPAHFFPPSTTRLPDRNVLSVMRFANVPAAHIVSFALSYLAKVPIPAQSTGDVLQPSTKDGYPVMVFSHGLGGATGNYSNTCIDVASHGYIVVAPEHTDGSAFEALIGSDNTPIPYLRYNSRVDGPVAEFREKQIDTRCSDISSLLGVLERSSRGGGDHNDDGAELMTPLRKNCPVPSLKGMLDMKRIVVAGHSFGAATALVFTSREKPTLWSKPQAVICLDAWMIPLRNHMETLKLPEGTNLLFVDMAESDMKESIKLRSSLLKESGISDDGLFVADAVKVLEGLHNNSSDFPLRIPKTIAIAAQMTKKNTSSLHLLKAQNLAMVQFLEGTENWREFRELVKNQGEDLLRIV